MKHIVFTASFIAIFIILSFCATPVFAKNDIMQKIHPWVVEHTSNNQQAEFMVMMNERPDLSPAFDMPDKESKARFVYETLLGAANRSQASLRKWLDERKIEYRWFYTTNALLIKGDWSLVQTIAARDDVAHIYGNPVIHNTFPVPDFNPATLYDPLTIEWNISQVHAPQVWTMGYRGQGVVVGAQDTGYRWTHAAVKNQYRGWNGTTADHNYNWHDSIHSGGGACGFDSTQPCDDYGHGTHTLGTVLGSDFAPPTTTCTSTTTNQVGMAPCARWIGCRNMDVGAGTPARYIECFDFFLAPYPVGGTPSQGDPLKAPDVTTNSWTCPTSEGCTWNQLQPSVDAHYAAGIMFADAAGNSGSSCNTITDAPSMYANTFTVGSTTNTSAMSSFSSRGPGTGSGLMKPDIVSPGSNVRSSYYSSDTSYTTMSGTSMATPCTAGGITLLWSCIPGLKNDIALTRTILNATDTRLTAVVESCGGDYVNGPNNTWGYGQLNVQAACQYCATIPTAPATVTATPGNNQVTISWSAVTGATVYKVYRGAGTTCPSARYTLKGSVTAPTVTYLDTSVTNGTTYAYVVRTIATNCPSVNSSCAQATPTAGSTPSGMVQNNLKITKSGTNLSLTWTAPGGTCSVTGYGLYRGTLPYTTYNHAMVSCAITTTSTTTPQDTSSYYYLIVPLNSTVEGSYGKSSAGIERPQGTSPCHAQSLTTC